MTIFLLKEFLLLLFSAPLLLPELRFWSTTSAGYLSVLKESLMVWEDLWYSVLFIYVFIFFNSFLKSFLFWILSFSLFLIKVSCLRIFLDGCFFDFRPQKTTFEIYQKSMKNRSRRLPPPPPQKKEQVHDFCTVLFFLKSRTSKMWPPCGREHDFH